MPRILCGLLCCSPSICDPKEIGPVPDICIIFNPTAQGDRARAFRKRLNSIEREAVLRPTRGPGDAQGLAARAFEEGFRTVVAAGGDGTVNEVVNGLTRSQGGLDRVKFGVLPLGTVNVFAKELGIPGEFDRAWGIIQEGRTLLIDLPYADFMTATGPARRYWVQLAGAGLDSRALSLVRWELKKKIGALAYVWAGFEAMRPPRPRVTFEAEGISIVAEAVLIGNGRYFGGRWPVLHGADMTDGLMDVAVIPKISWPRLFRALWLLWRDRFSENPGTTHLQVRSFRLTTADGVPLQLEGDNVGPLPATFGLLPRALRVVVPSG